MVTIYVDLAGESGELSVRNPEKLVNGKADPGIRLLEFVGFAPKRSRAASPEKNSYRGMP
jgi:hypothetical protein